MKIFWKAARPVLVVLAVTIVFLLSYLIISSIFKSKEPKFAHDITGVETDGRTLYSLSDGYGKAGTVLVFFDIDTGKAVELLQQLTKAAPESTVNVVAVATSQKSIEEQKQLLADAQIVLPHILFDLDGEMAKTYNVHGTPVTYFIDKNGVIHDAYIASISAESLRKSIEKIA